MCGWILIFLVNIDQVFSPSCSNLASSVTQHGNNWPTSAGQSKESKKKILKLGHEPQFTWGRNLPLRSTTKNMHMVAARICWTIFHMFSTHGWGMLHRRWNDGRCIIKIEEGKETSYANWGSHFTFSVDVARIFRDRRISSGSLVRTRGPCVLQRGSVGSWLGAQLAPGAPDTVHSLDCGYPKFWKLFLLKKTSYNQENPLRWFRIGE